MNSAELRIQMRNAIKLVAFLNLAGIDSRLAETMSDSDWESAGNGAGLRIVPPKPPTRAETLRLLRQQEEAMEVLNTGGDYVLG